LPAIGYQPAFELQDATERTRQGLPSRELPPADDPVGRRRGASFRNEGLVEVDAVIGTDPDQIAITPGTLVSEWRENGRRYFHYRTQTPLSHGAPILSARYAVREDRWESASAEAGGVALKILHHPTHTFNLDRLMRSMKATLDYCASEFGPYPFRELRILEFPRYASFARAHPHTIAFSEGGAFLTRVADGDVDRPFFVTAHETAHQWWGGQLVPARVKGAALLTETLAQYSSMMVLERTYGEQHARKFYDFAMDYYLRGRSAAVRPEVPLLRVEDESHLYYQKGALAMYTLREQLGEPALNAALRRLLERHRSPGPPYPTALDLYAELRSAAPQPLHGLLRDLFEEVTFWDVRTESALVEATGDGAHRVTLQVHASKRRVDALGKEAEVPMDDLVDIGVFARPGAGEARGEPLYLRQHRLRSGRQSVVVTVARPPAQAGVDPYKKLIQKRSDDNVEAVEVSTER
jgi:aminopeptidase N